jgi:hypothetical protein
MQVSTHCTAYKDLQEVLWVSGKTGEESCRDLRFKQRFCWRLKSSPGMWRCVTGCTWPPDPEYEDPTILRTPGTNHKRHSATPPEDLNLKFKDFGSYSKCTNWSARTCYRHSARCWPWVWVPSRAWISSLFSRTVKTVPDRHTLWLSKGKGKVHPTTGYESPEGE